MPFDFATAKALLRSKLSDNMGLAAFYQDASLIAPAPIRVRYNFKKLETFGDLVDTGYAKVAESAEQIVLRPSDYPEIDFIRNGIVTIESMEGVEFLLKTLDPKTNDIEEVWQVVRK